MPTQMPGTSLTAVLIVRDEARCIARCLESVRPHVDRILVVDTGSTDATAALAATGGAEVHHMAWPHDFSAARNHALDLADADWNLILDADEWIVDGGAHLRAWCQGPDRVGKMCIHSAVDETHAGRGERRNWISRLLPRGVRFEGRVHEQAVTALPRERIALHIAHDGYLDDQIALKHGRNGPLLLRELAARPGDPYLLYQLAKDAEQRDNLPAAAEHYAAALMATPSDANWRHPLIVRTLYCLSKTGALDVALALAEQEMPHWGDSPDFFFTVGNLALDRALADPAHAFDQWLPLAASAWEKCLAIGERPELEESLQGCGSHLARHNLETVRAQMAAFAGSGQLGAAA